MSAPSQTMARSLLAPVPAPHWPEGVRLVPFETHHAIAAHALLADAYGDGGGTVPARFVQWWHDVSTDEEYDPALCFVAETADGSMAGFALCWTSGFLKDIAVARRYRRHGLGTALILAACGASRERGHRQLRLKVELENPSGAQQLYARLGFNPV